MAAVPSREPSSTAMISNVSARAGSAASASVDEALDVGLLVVGREEVGQAGDAARGAGRRSGRVDRRDAGPVASVTARLRAPDRPGSGRSRVAAVDRLELGSGRPARATSSGSERMR